MYSGSGEAVARGPGPHSPHVTGGGVRRKEDQHGLPGHRGLTCRQRGGRHPLQYHQKRDVRHNSSSVDATAFLSMTIEVGVVVVMMMILII